MTTDHIHHYKLPRPDGPTSIGVCKHCGAEKEHHNYVETDMQRAGRERRGHKSNGGRRKKA